MSVPPQAVTSLTENIKTLLESHFCHIVVKGELSNVSLQPSGHLYFGIKDEKSFLNGAFFHFKSKFFGRRPKDGDAVILHGKLTVYAPRGLYQIVAHALVYAGEGDLLQKFEELKKRLTTEGYFAMEKKKSLPKAPKCIGVITSPTGAVVQDILRVLSRRCYNYKVLIYPVTVQGESATKEICKALEVMNAENIADVLILARGGGSIEDLWSFNEEALVKAIHASKIPIISAVGHETDYTLCDLAADVRAPTPSAAAEIVCPSSEQQLQQLQGILNHLLSHSQQFFQGKKDQLLVWKRQLNRTEFFRTAQQQLDFVRIAIHREMLGKLLHYQQRCEHFSRWLQGDLLNKLSFRLQDVKKMLNHACTHKLSSLQNHYDLTKKKFSTLPQLHESAQRLISLKQQLDTLIFRRLYLYSQAFAHKRSLLKHVETTLYQQLHTHRQTLDLLQKRLFSHAQVVLANNKATHAHVRDRLSATIQQRLESAAVLYKNVCKHLLVLNPKNVLKRGYAMLFDFNEKIAILSVKSLQPSSRVRVQLHDGEAILAVTETKSFEPTEG